ncbi:condensin subunit Smc [Cohaesibacter sp. ES.047]|uniref:chromosome segregation SMC family protein n=1 Tax=Cohaesibacter sp. ES.047 TaxID=1798205 RepID=UPI000BB7BD39|nr:AAA family ATPase [Cohaesibacter sp. ES.047]SNY92423.1 condensin subunit Smc [Cohaesibacter sp. ES.047]
MIFTKLRLLGFKSFVEPMDFIIHPGLTGVVGPNGCGKSNLVEALRWVMGENSYRNMRASGMDDVIFAGSTHRPARNTAEVTVFLDNTARTAPAGFNDEDAIEISRRIERESGSAYKINGKDVRARDVQLLFADASTGARSPSLVGQGRIGEIISQKPTQRRGLLEEAAGISGLHSRRHEAELRLKAAEGNLERLEDIMAQIATQLEGLKRQARQANRYRNLSSDIRSTEATLYHLRWRDVMSDEEKAKEELRRADLAVAEATTQQSAAAREEAVAKHQLPDLRNKQAEKAAALQRLTLAARELDGEEQRVKEKMVDLTRRVEQLKEDRAREQQLVTENADLLAALDEEKAQLVTEEEATGTTRLEAEKALADAEAELQKAESHASDLTARLAEAEGTARQMAQATEAARGRVARLASQTAQSRRDLDKVSDELDRDSDLDVRRAEVETASEELEVLEAAAETASIAVAEMREAETEARRARADAESAFNRLDTEARTLARIVQSGEDTRFPTLMSRLKVEAGYETALAAALGDDLDAALDANAARHWDELPPFDDDPDLPNDLPRLAEMVAGPDRVTRRLNQIGIVAASDGAGMQPLLKPGQRLVSLAGDLWRWDGLVMKAGAPTSAAQRLEQRNRLEELEGRLEEAQDQLEMARRAFQEKQDAAADSAKAEQTARNRWRDAQKRLSLLRDALSRAERDANQLLARKATLEATLERLVEDEEEARAVLYEAEQQLQDLPDFAHLQRERDEARLVQSETRSLVAEARANVQGLTRETDMRQRRLEAIERERSSWVARAQNADAQIATLDARLQETEKEISALEDAPDDFAARRRSLLSGIAKAEEIQKEASDALAEAERAAMEADVASKVAMEGLSTTREARSRADERVKGIESRKQELTRQIAEALDCAPAATFGLAGLKQGAPLPAMAAIESKLERLRNERERLGGVNLRADEEATEISDQLSTMETERDDLIEAIKKLRNGIFNLNKEARARLLASFEVVNEHFKSLFSKLFGGGQAELQLTEADDPLQAGLDIVARPPGKKPQTMTLLSGGEQALTAMSLIFAVFLTNPAPICVLDEVDAPLDDANVERFCTLLLEMRQLTETRFVTITHNPITMSRMDRLFGVTMAERGISQLVSVNLEAAEELISDDDEKAALATVPPGHPSVDRA